MPLRTRSWYTNKINTSSPFDVQGIEVIDVDESNVLPYSPTFNTPKKRKKRKMNEDIKEIRSDTDTLNKLPDDVLIYLLSFLDIKTAGRTSCLSKRWRSLLTYITDLDFKDPDDFNKDSLCDSSRCFSYLKWVNHVTSVHRALNMNSMRIRFPLIRSHEDKGIWSIESHLQIYLERWIEFGLRRNIVKLELNLARAFADETEIYQSIPFQMRRSNLSHFNLSWRSPYLKFLHLESLYIDGPLVEKVLSNCLNLEQLIVKTCVFKSFHSFCPYQSTSITIKVSSLKLKYLEFDRCHTKSIEICGPNLKSLVLIPLSTTRMLNRPIVEVECTTGPSLVDATFGTSYLFRIIHTSTFSSSGLAKLSLRWEEKFFRKDEIIALISVIEACPLLHTFKLEMHNQWPCINDRGVEMYVENAIAHQHLKLIEIIGCDKYWSIQKLVFCLTHPMHTPKLKKVIFDPCCPQFLHKFCESEHNFYRNLGREQSEVVAALIPKGVDFVIP